VLEHDARDEEVECFVREELKIRPIVGVIRNSLAVAVQRSSQIDHGKREVDSIDAREVRRKGLRQSANTAAEVEGPPPLDADAS
jgi:hypothetical protein